MANEKQTPAGLVESEPQPPTFTEQKADKQAGNITSALETLPTELKVLILRSCHDWSTLCALIRSSPDYYHAYVRHRPSILQDVIPCLFSEMRSAVKARSLARGDVGLPSMEQFVDEYRNGAEDPAPSVEESQEIIQFFRAARAVANCHSKYNYTGFSEPQILIEALFTGDFELVCGAVAHFETYKALSTTSRRLYVSKLHPRELGQLNILEAVNHRVRLFRHDEHTRLLGDVLRRMKGGRKARPNGRNPWLQIKR